MRLPKPNPPILKEIKIDTNIDCNKDKMLCDIISNFQNLITYICTLEASPLWEQTSENLCK